MLDLATRISQCLQPRKSASPSNTCANSTHSRFSRVLEYKKGWAMARKSISSAPLEPKKKVRNTLQIPVWESPLLRSYVYRYENNEILKTLRLSRFLKMCNLRTNLKFVQNGPPKSTPFLDPLYFKSLHACTGFKHFFEAFLDMEREGRWKKWSFQAFWRGWLNPSI